MDIASALAWAPVCMLPGMFLGVAIHIALPPGQLALLELIIVALLLILFYILSRYFKVR